jgi:hypothetical protein
MKMDASQILNAAMYPSSFDNVRRKQTTKYDSATLATGTLEYYFFTTALGNIYARNTRLPLSGTEVFFITGLSMYLRQNINTVALLNNLNETLLQGYLQISVDNRVQCRLPLADLLQYTVMNVLTATGSAILPQIVPMVRKLPIPIMLNSTSAFEFKLVVPTASATAFNTNVLSLSLYGIQFDKLEPFYYNALKDNQFQRVPVTYYNTQTISTTNETTYSFFTNIGQANNLYSQQFPLSDITTAEIQNIEVFVSNPDTPIEGTTLYNSSLQKVLRVTVDDIVTYESTLQDMLSTIALFSTTLTTTPDTTVLALTHIRQSESLQIPLLIPAQSKVSVTVQQPGSSLPITGDITVILRGIETRKVA